MARDPAARWLEGLMGMASAEGVSRQTPHPDRRHPVSADAARLAFIRANTSLRPVPLCPEIALHVADEAFDLWFRTEEELAEDGLPPPFWAFAWAGGQALARYVLDHPGTVAGRTVLDLGTGSGLVGVAARRAGARQVTAADTDPWAATACRLNAEANAAEVNIVTEDLLDTTPQAETVLIGDLFYDRDVAGRLMAFLDRAAAAGSDVLIGDPGRTYLPKARLDQLAEFGVPTTRALEDAEIKRTAVWRMTDRA